MEIQELKYAAFRTFNLSDNKTEILFSENNDGLVFPINLDYKKEVLIFEEESIPFDSIKEIKITFCYNKVGFKNIPCYKLHVYLDNKNINFKRYLGLFEYTENNDFISKLPKVTDSLINEYKSFKDFIENKNKEDEKAKEEVNIQYSKFHLIDMIIKKFIKK
tara:strand:- start:870 stop:1355 length:486 start_codon:yes stop_codon:yes gene_type:complete